MPSHTVYEFRAPGFPVAAASPSNSFFFPASVVSIGESANFSRAAISRAAQEDNGDNNPDGLGLARGVRSAILLQGCMFLMGYGIWHLWHLAH